MRQKGFTLVELLVALAIGSMITTGVVIGIQQVFMGTTSSKSQVLVLDEVNRATLQLKKDLQSRDSANISGDSHAITLNWINNTAFEDGGPQPHSATYYLSGTRLLRSGDNATRIVGRQIESIIFSENGSYINVVITANTSGFPYRSETLSFSVTGRIDEVEE